VPATERGNVYMFTTACGFSGWYWAIPVPDDTGATAAKVFAERVMCDLAGTCAIVCSDRARAFTDGMFKELARAFGIHQVLGMAYHPESQVPAERPHREYNKICKLFMDEWGKDWDTIACWFQWSIRTTAKVFSKTFTPYETLLGIKPRMPTDALLQSNSVLIKCSTEDYVRDLIIYLKEVHQSVSDKLQHRAEEQQEQQFRRYGVGARLEVGDFVMLHKGPHQFGVGVSRRFVPKNWETVYQIVEAHGEDRARAFTLCDASTGKRHDLGFEQPVSGDRLVPIEVMPLTRPTEEGRTYLRCNGRHGQITGQALDGKVAILWDGEADSELVDLARIEYEWAYI
jgi:hypothetical protein